VKKFPFFVVLCLFGGLLSAQNSFDTPWWYTMERGKLLFRDGNYGEALLAFEDARRQRFAEFSRMEKNLVELLSVPEVRRLGDSLEGVETYLSEHHYPDAAAALEALYYHAGKEELGNSVVRALETLGRLKEYPDAEYWIGETWRVEGELGVALRQFRKAWDRRLLLENPGFEAELLYKIVDIHKTRQEYMEMEKTLLDILGGEDPAGNPRDPLWAGNSFAKTAMSRTLENEGINRFLALYRYLNTAVEAAHRLLGFYYYASGRQSPGPAGEHLMFAFLIQNTVIMEELIRSRYDYTFTTLEALMGELDRKPALQEYIDRVEYFRTAYYLGAALYGAGKPGAARSLWTFLAGKDRAGEWQNRARRQLRQPFNERALESP
jgi:tetratricopeptide (TPR) repeat protein